MMVAATTKAASVWGTTQPGAYDPDKVYKRAADQNGHSHKAQFNIAPDLHTQAVSLVNDPNWPEYESFADVGRDAFMHLIHQRAHQMTKPEDRESAIYLLNMFAREEAIANFEDMIGRYKRMQQRLDNILVDLLHAEAWDLMRAWLDEDEEQVRDLPEPFRAKAMNQIRMWREKLPKA